MKEITTTAAETMGKNKSKEMIASQRIIIKTIEMLLENSLKMIIINDFDNRGEQGVFEVPHTKIIDLYD